MDNIFQKFIDKLKNERSEEEFNDFITNLINISSSELYWMMLSQLTDEDLKTIENITDDDEANKKIDELFQLRTNMTPEEFIKGLIDAIAKEKFK